MELHRIHTNRDYCTLLVAIIIDMSSKSQVHPPKRNVRPNTPSKNAIASTLTDNSNFRTYLLNSTLHGLRYVGQRTISAAERCFFGIAFVLVVLLAGYFITNVYVKWRASPIIISLNAVATSITDIPFPAVTICNMNQARRDVVDKFASGSNDELLVHSLCGTRNASALLERATDTSWRYFHGFLGKVSRPCRDIFVTCRYGTRSHLCAKLFETVLTDEGVCCIFNGVHKRFLLKHYRWVGSKQLFPDYSRANTFFSVLNSEASDTIDWSTNKTPDNTSSSDTPTPPTDDGKPPFHPIEWTAEHGFQDDPNVSNGEQSRSYPRRALGSGSHMGLTVLVNVHASDYYCSTTNSAGFKVLLHPPTETPKIADYGFAVAPGDESRIVITPQISDASPLIRTIPLSQRQCIFADEANLTYFRWANGM